MIDLILEFAEWPMTTKPEIGMEIFTADTENAESLPTQRVLSFLEIIDAKYAIQYLEHIIGKGEIRMNLKKVEAVNEWPTPKNLKELQEILGLSNWF